MPVSFFQTHKSLTMTKAQATVLVIVIIMFVFVENGHSMLRGGRGMNYNKKGEKKHLTDGYDDDETQMKRSLRLAAGKGQ